MTPPAPRRNVEIGLLLVLMLVIGAATGFAVLMSEVSEGETTAFDSAILLALRTPGDLSDPLGPLWLEEFMRDVSGFGGVGMLTAVTIAVAILLALMRNVRAAGFLVLSVATGALLSTAFKHVVDRPRPDLVPHGSYVSTASFPSGHSMMSAVVYLTLAVMIARTQTSLAVRIYIMTLAMLMTVGVGISRVYLGVHWPTDVLGGWALGTAWALACALAAAWLGRHGEIEPEGKARSV